MKVNNTHLALAIFFFAEQPSPHSTLNMPGNPDAMLVITRKAKLCFTMEFVPSCNMDWTCIYRRGKNMQ